MAAPFLAIGPATFMSIHFLPSHSQVSPKRLPEVPARLCPPKRTILPRLLSNAIVASARGEGPTVLICTQLQPSHSHVSLRKLFSSGLLPNRTLFPPKRTTLLRRLL